MPVNLETHSDPKLVAMYQAYMRDVGAHIRINKPYWGSALGVENGTLTNLEQGAAFILTLGNSSLATGCVALQSKTEQVLSAAGGGANWQVIPIRVGSSVMGHSAVAVYPTGSAMEKGYVFDPWITQTPLVYTFEEWENNFRLMSVMGEARVQ